MDEIMKPVSPPPKTPFSEMKVWLFDLDNTLYPESCQLFDQVDQNITRYICENLKLEWDEAHKLQKSFFRHHGTTMRGLMIEHDINPTHFLDFVHDIDLDSMPKNPVLGRALSCLPGRKIIFTNGSAAHAENIMNKLGIAQYFEAIFDIVASNYRPKPEPIIYNDIVKRFDIPSLSTVMVEDMARNLKPANDLGMTCVWIQSKNQWGQESSHEDHVHYVVDDLTKWLCKLTNTSDQAPHL